jgi:predicted HTH transcriptional regulator
MQYWTVERDLRNAAMLLLASRPVRVRWQLRCNCTRRRARGRQSVHQDERLGDGLVHGLYVCVFYSDT